MSFAFRGGSVGIVVNSLWFLACVDGALPCLMVIWTCLRGTFRCIDFVTYYPNQHVPASYCAYMACGGSLLETGDLAADSDFNRTFGAADATCATDEEVGNR